MLLMKGGVNSNSPLPLHLALWAVLWQHHVVIGYKGLVLGDKKTFITQGDLRKMSCRCKIKNVKYL